MPIVDCRVGERLWFDEDICLHLTGRLDDVLFVFIDAARRHAFDTDAKFHASASCRRKRTGHVAAIRMSERVSIGPITVRVENPCVRLSGARPLRDVRLVVLAPTGFSRMRNSLTPSCAASRTKGATC